MNSPANDADWLYYVRFRLTEVVMIESRGDSYQLLFKACPAPILLASHYRHGSIVIDGILNPLSPDKVFVIQPGQRVEIDYPFIGQQILYLFYYEMSAGEGSHIGADAIRRLPQVAAVSSQEQLLGLCQKIVEHWHTDDAADRLASEAGFQDLLHLLLKRQGWYGDVLEQVRLFLERHYTEVITVDYLAGMAGMSRYYFMRSYKERYGQSIMEYLTEIRMNKAKQLMEEGFVLREITEAVGYKDPQYFSSQFSKYSGMSPSVYVANRKERIAAYSWPNIGHLLSLQIIPYAAPIDQSWADEYRRKYRFDVKVPLSHDYDFNRQALWRARPDKIIALEEMIPDEEKARLQQIAPTLFVPWHSADWRVHLQMTAKFLNREAEAEKWLARYDEQAAAIRMKVPTDFQAGAWLILTLCPRGIKIWGRRAGTVLYDDLQLPCAKGVEQIEFTTFEEVGQLGRFDADVMLVHVLKDAQSQSLWQKTRLSEDWGRLKPVCHGQVLQTSNAAWMAEPILEYTANRQELLLQELDQLFSAL
ncbi:AraC family transcriptional regulator [Paenibacillus sp. 79R4]|uniref:AraC family transcriptional regulator n=1 Tax=Paenibacillus sp. 79R4 TaxID=2212847 RepID=UPI0015BE5308|nr:AraC family transcriptional regulator [Paenibacillus sp. 79R4]NWL87958.1 AraC family transcriptional regulator [Paenibacillus sp. 79R4]